MKRMKGRGGGCFDDNYDGDNAWFVRLNKELLASWQEHVDMVQELKPTCRKWKWFTHNTKKAKKILPSILDENATLNDSDFMRTMMMTMRKMIMISWTVQLNKGSSFYKSTKISFPVFWMRTPHSTTVWGRGCPTGFLSFGPFLKDVTNHQSTIINHWLSAGENLMNSQMPHLHIIFERTWRLAYLRWNIINCMTFYWPIMPFQGGSPFLIIITKSLS